MQGWGTKEDIRKVSRYIKCFLYSLSYVGFYHRIKLNTLVFTASRRMLYKEAGETACNS